MPSRQANLVAPPSDGAVGASLPSIRWRVSHRTISVDAATSARSLSWLFARALTISETISASLRPENSGTYVSGSMEPFQGAPAHSNSGSQCRGKPLKINKGFSATELSLERARHEVAVGEPVGPQRLKFYSPKHAPTDPPLCGHDFLISLDLPVLGFIPARVMICLLIGAIVDPPSPV
jgi:hypothetical protein